MILIGALGAAIDANAPVQDDADGNGPIDSDEEKDAVMVGLARSRPQPLVTHPLIPTRRKYHLVRVKEMLSQAFPPATGGLFSSNNSGLYGGLFFQSDSNDAVSDHPDADATAKSPSSQQPSQNRTTQAATGKKASAA